MNANEDSLNGLLQDLGTRTIRMPSEPLRRDPRYRQYLVRAFMQPLPAQVQKAEALIQRATNRSARRLAERRDTLLWCARARLVQRWYPEGFWAGLLHENPGFARRYDLAQHASQQPDFEPLLGLLTEAESFV